MALSKNYIKNVCGKEVQFENTYIQIVFDSGNKENRDIDVVIYDNSQKQNVIEQKRYHFIPNIENESVNFIKQGYEHLKTLDEYNDALDC